MIAGPVRGFLMIAGAVVAAALVAWAAGLAMYTFGIGVL